MMKTLGRAHQAILFIKRLCRLETPIRPLDDSGSRKVRQEKSIPALKEFKTWLDEQANAVLPKSVLEKAIFYALKNWDALCRYTEAGYLEADNNFAERCMRHVALGRTNFSVGPERVGKAAAIYYSLVESCKHNKVNPLTYLTYVLSNVRNNNIALLLPDEFDQNDITQIGQHADGYDESIAEPRTLQLTPREHQLALKYGYPFPGEAELLESSKVKNGLHVVKSMRTGSACGSRISCARRRPFAARDC